MANKDILILGAGPAGMACAMELFKAGANFTLVEKAEQVGGLAKTYQFGKFRTDNGPHRFFSQNKYLYDFVEDLLGERWIKVDRFTRFYINGKFYKYPVEWKNALFTMGLWKSSRVFLDYLIERLKFFKGEPENFEEYIVSTFGRTLAEFNFLNYTEKVWGLPCSKLSVDWANQRIRGLTVTSLLKSALFNKISAKSLVDQFYYPSLGTGLIYEEIKKRIEKKCPVLLKRSPTEIKHSKNRITEVILNTGDNFKPDNLVSSIPLPFFVKLLNPAPPKNVLEALKNLRYRSQVYLFLTIDKPSVSKDQWIYFPGYEVPFGRVSEMKNFSKEMAPPDKTSLFVEYFCWEGDDIWNKNKEELKEITVTWLEKLGLIKSNEVLDSFLIKQPNVYPVYDLDYKKHLDVLKAYLDGFSNLMYIGRPGRFKYNNQDHSLEMGILAARSIIEGKKYNIEDVGAEKSYFERGYLKT